MFSKITTGLIWRFTGAKTCIWNQRDEGRERRGRRSESLAVKLTPFFVSNGISGDTFLHETLGVAKDKAAIIHNGIALEASRQN